MTPEKFQQLLKKYREGRCTAEEEKFVEEWFAAISTNQIPFNDDEETTESKASSWKKIDQAISVREDSGSVDLQPSSQHRYVWAVAACVLLAAALLFMIGLRNNSAPGRVAMSVAVAPTEWEIIHNQNAGPIEFYLPDRSRIKLLPGGKVTFSSSLQPDKREVYLDGEAFFDVAKDETRPFLVYTMTLTTRVLGTSFFIRAYNGLDEIVVSVQTGTVQVYTSSLEGGSKPQQLMTLKPNQQVVYNRGDHRVLKKLISEPQLILPHSTLQDSYTNAPVVDILKSLEDNFGVDIVYDSALLTDCTLTSDMSEEGFYEQIKIICNALGAEYRLQDTAIVIEASGCKTY